MDLAEIGATPAGGSHRVALTDEDAAGRALFTTWAAEAGCVVEGDRVGNLFATRAGSSAARPPVLVGSHLDTQPDGGRFDGPVGVLAGLEIVRTLNDAGIDTDAPVVVVSWVNEEGARFPLPLTGSSVYSGLLSEDGAKAQRALDGPTFGDELARLGLAGDAVGPAEIDSYFELHIEQNTTLEASRTDIGIVERGQGIRALRATLRGTSAHAGTTEMADRRDALVTAARVIARMDELARSTGTLVTVGSVEVSPNSRSVVPGEVTLIVDIRHGDERVLADVTRDVAGEIERIAAADGLALELEQTLEIPVVRFDERCGDAIRDACEALGLSWTSLVSGAGHDAMSIARTAPAALVFIPCRDGVSHHPAEYASPEQVGNGCDAILHAVLARAGVVGSAGATRA
jgi:N-carbamoyl-L-amino-acid hydrolase